MRRSYEARPELNFKHLFARLCVRKLIVLSFPRHHLSLLWLCHESCEEKSLGNDLQHIFADDKINKREKLAQYVCSMTLTILWWKWGNAFTVGSFRSHRLVSTSVSKMFIDAPSVTQTESRLLLAKCYEMRLSYFNCRCFPPRFCIMNTTTTLERRRHISESLQYHISLAEKASKSLSSKSSANKRISHSVASPASSLSSISLKQA